MLSWILISGSDSCRLLLCVLSLILLLILVLILVGCFLFSWLIESHDVGMPPTTTTQIILLQELFAGPYFCQVRSMCVTAHIPRQLVLILL